MECIIEIHCLADLESKAAQILEAAGGKKIFAFYGDPGAGKTTMIKALCRLLGVKEGMSSPSFALVHEYEGAEKIYHLDFYRLRSEREAMDIGYEHYLYSDKHCFIEWPSRVEGLLPAGTVRVYVEPQEGEKRIVRVILN